MATNPRPYSITKIDSTGCDSTLAYCSAVGLNEQKINNEEFKIYPNPTSGIINFKVENGNKILIFNILGELVKEEELIVDKQKVDLSNLQNGIYLLQVFDKNKLIGTTKTIKE